MNAVDDDATSAEHPEEQPLQTLFSQAPAFIALHEGPDHVYVFSNPLHDQIAGHRPLIGKGVREAFPELEGQGVFERFDSVYQTGKPDVRYEMPATFRRSPEGPPETGYFSQMLCPWRNADGTIRGVMSFAFEVTETVRMRRHLEKKEACDQQQLLELNTLYRTAPIGLGLVDAEMRYVRVNEQLAAINGAPVKDHIGRTIRDVLPELADTIEPLYRRVVDSGETLLNLEVQGTTPQQPDVLRDWLVSYYPVPGQEGDVRAVGSIVQEVTERRRVEEALQKSEARFRGTFENAAVGVAHVDKRGRWRYVNRALCNILGYTREELLARTFSDVSHPDDVGVSMDRFRLLMRGEITEHTLEKRYLHKDGHVVWVRLTASLQRDEAGEPQYNIAIAEDITERKQAEEALRESEERYRVVAETASDALITADEASTILFVNPAAEKVFGHSREAMLGQKLTMLMPEYLRHVHEAAIARYVETGQRHLSWEAIGLPGLHKSGQEVPLEVSFGEFIKDGKHYFTSIVRDITERKEAEAALRNTRAQINAALAAGAIATWDWDVPRDRVFGDRVLAAWFGVLDEEAEGHAPLDRYLEAIHSDDRERVAGAIGTTVEHGGEYAIDYRIEPPSGPLRWVEARGRVEHDETGQPVRMVGVLIDVTERKQAEEALCESRERLDFALDVAGLGQWDMNLEDQAAFRSLRHDQIFGYDSLLQEWTYESFLEHVLPEDRAAVSEKFDHAVQHGGDWDFECRIRRADGVIRWISARGRLWRNEGGEPRRMLGTVADITERKGAEEALRKSELRFRSTFENAAVGMAHVGTDGSWLRVNEKLCEIVGYTREELLRKTFQDLTHPEDVGPDLEQFTQLLRGEIDSYQMEKRYFHKKGHIVWIHLTVALQRDAAGQPLYSISVIQDIGQRKRMEGELVAAKEQAEEMAHLKSVFLANMSHEIRTPLTGILGFASLLAKKVSEAHRPFAEIIESAGRRLLDTLNAVLTLAKLEAGRADINLKPLRVLAEVEAMVKLFHDTAQSKGLHLDVRCSPEASEVEAPLDSGAFASLLQNLISNAVKFTDDGSITLTVTADPLEAGGLGAPRRVHIAVEDTGIGVEAAFLPYLFDEFRQESSGVGRSYEGTGLGLALTKRLAELMGGTIAVESRKGEGSRFTLSFPLAEEKDEPPEHPASLEQPPPDPGARVLIVEDNTDARLLMQTLLEDTYEIALAENAEEALAAARQAHYDLVLLDINLGPGATGEEVLASLRTLPAYRHIPIVALTAHALPGDRERFLGLGFTDHLAKPFKVNTFLALLSDLTAYASGDEA